MKLYSNFQLCNVLKIVKLNVKERLDVDRLTFVDHMAVIIELYIVIGNKHCVRPVD